MGLPKLALGLGIAAFGICWIPIFGWLGVLLGLGAALLGLTATLRPQHGRAAVAGLALGLAALILGLVVQVPVAIALARDAAATHHIPVLPATDRWC